MENMVQVSYTLTLDEYLKAREYAQKTTSGKKRKANRIFIEFAISILVGKLLDFLGIFSLVFTGISRPIFYAHFFFPYDVIYIFIIIRLFSIWQFRSTTQKRYQVQVHPKGKTVMVNSEGIVSENELRKIEYKWDVVTEVLLKPDLILMYVGQGAVIIVPTRAFQSEQEAKRFMGLVIEYHKTEKYI